MSESKLTPEEQAAKEHAAFLANERRKKGVFPDTIAYEASFIEGVEWHKEQSASNKENSFTREQVEELLRKQRNLCYEYSVAKKLPATGIPSIVRDSILNAPSPLNEDKDER